MVEEVDISLGQERLTEADHIGDLNLRIIKRYKKNIKKHPTVVTIFENHGDSAFSFKRVSLDEITKKISLDVKKACQDTNIAT